MLDISPRNRAGVAVRCGLAQTGLSDLPWISRGGDDRDKSVLFGAGKVPQRMGDKSTAAVNVPFSSQFGEPFFAASPAPRLTNRCCCTRRSRAR
jgi:hypothetical protein